MKSTKPIFVSQKGGVTIPVELRKKYNLSPETEVAFVELEGVIFIIPIREEGITSNISLKEMSEIYDKSREEEMMLE